LRNCSFRQYTFVAACPVLLQLATTATGKIVGFYLGSLQIIAEVHKIARLMQINYTESLKVGTFLRHSVGLYIRLLATKADSNG